MTMKRLFSVVVFTTAFCIGQSSAGWVVSEESCRGSTDFVKDVMRNAFRLADSAQTALTLQPDGLLKQEHRRLLRWLFAPDADDAELEETRKEVRDLYTWIQGLNQEGNSDNPSLNVYCNNDRYIQRKEDNGRWYNKETGRIEINRHWNEVLDGPYDPRASCKPPSTINVLNPFDETAIPHLAETEIVTNGMEFSITICPWFLDLQAKNNLRTSYNFDTWKKTQMLKLFSVTDRVAKHFFTPVDLFQLIDKVMLHELSHTYVKKTITDVNDYGGYGWKNCRKLTANPKDSLRNADTFALFGGCCKLLENGMTIDEDGRAYSEDE